MERWMQEKKIKFTRIFKVKKKPLKDGKDVHNKFVTSIRQIPFECGIENL